MNEKCCICPHFNNSTGECEADTKIDTCLIDVIESVYNKFMEVE